MSKDEEEGRWFLQSMIYILIPFVEGPPHIDSCCGEGSSHRFLVWRGFHLLIPCAEEPTQFDSFCGGASTH